MADCTQFEGAVSNIEDDIQRDEAFCQQLFDSGEINEAKKCRVAVGRKKGQLERAKQALRNCEAGLPTPGIKAARGHVTFLRVHDAHGFGPNNDFLDAEIIFQLDTHPGRSFGFQMRDDASRPAHEGMLAVLRDAFVHDLDVNINYRQELEKSNSVAFRIELRRKRF
jgi:hypothetical protein